jgi:hypothetical protein
LFVLNKSGDSAQQPDSSTFTPADILRPSAFPHPVGKLELRETNLSWVILTGLYAYKIKKSVQFAFIDASTLEKRRRMCEEELRLNRRLAPELYMDVVFITHDADGARVVGKGPVIEYAVRMRQFDASEELSALLENGTVSAHEMTQFAERLAEFHAGAERTARGADYLYTGQLHDAVLGNLAILLSHLDDNASFPELGTLVDWTHDRLHDSLTRLEMREQSGFIRECHGDLHARNVVRWRGRLIPFDSLDFDPKLRWIDTMNDVAFMVMDLIAHDRNDLASAFLNSYLENSGDYDGVELLPFYAVYRALVRAMVDSIGAKGDVAHRDEYRRRLQLRVETAAAFIHRPKATLFIMHGPSGSGKSWLSERLAAQFEAVRVRSDVERKRLAGFRSLDARVHTAEQGIYTPEFSHRTYARLLESAESCLKGSVNVIVDAAFLCGEPRRLFRELAARQGSRFVIVSCEADYSVLTKRIEGRRQSHADPSDADIAVLDRQLHDLEPLCPDERLHAIAVDTGRADAYEKVLLSIQMHLTPAAKGQAEYRS